MNYLRSGKVPKEIAQITGYSVWGIYKFIDRHRSVRMEYFETHPLRYPNRENPIALRTVVQ